MSDITPDKNENEITFEAVNNCKDTYQTTSPKDIFYFLRKIHDEDYLLPSFQRNFDWNKQDVIELFRSLFKGYPIGSLLLCPTNEKTREFYKPKNFNYEDKKESNGYIVLDGQQRLTSIYRAFTFDYKTQPENEEDKRYYYFFEIKVNHEKELIRQNVTLNIFASEKHDILFDYKDNRYYFPVYLLGNHNERVADKNSEWIDNFVRVFSQKSGKDNYEVLKEARDLFSCTEKGIFSELNQPDLIPALILTEKASNDVKKVCDIFNKINDSGTGLTDFDKFCAVLFAKGIDLRKIWNKLRIKHSKLKEFKIDPVAFIRSMSLFEQRQEEGEDDPDEDEEYEYSVHLNYIKNYINEFKNETELRSKMEQLGHYFDKALNHLSGNQGIVSYKWIPRTPILITYVSAWAVINERYDQRKHNNLYEKLDIWYWNNVFGLEFDGNTIRPISKEFESLLNWFEHDSKKPKTIKNFSHEEVELSKLEKQSQAQYRGIMCLLVKNGAIDFFTGHPLNNHKTELDDHHIWPEDYLGKVCGISNSKRINIVANRTLIKLGTNRSKSVGNKSPKDYLKDIRKEMKEEKFQKLCRTQLLYPDLDSKIYESYDDFVQFRQEKLLELIKGVTSLETNSKN